MKPDLLLFPVLRAGWTLEGQPSAGAPLAGPTYVASSLDASIFAPAIVSDGSRPSARGRLPGVSAVDPWSLSKVAGGPASGRRLQPYGAAVPRAGRAVED